MYLFHAFPRFISLFSCLCQTVQCLETRSYQLPYRPKDRVGSPLEWPDVFVLSNSEWKSKNFGQNSHWVVTWWTSDPSVTSGALLQFRILKTDLRVVPIVHTLYTRLWIVTCRKDQQRLVYSRICDSRKRKRQDVNREKKTACPFNPAPGMIPMWGLSTMVPSLSPRFHRRSPRSSRFHRRRVSMSCRASSFRTSSVPGWAGVRRSRPSFCRKKSSRETFDAQIWSQSLLFFVKRRKLSREGGLFGHQKEQSTVLILDVWNSTIWLWLTVCHGIDGPLK